jgi:hypothetical protein
MTVCRHLTGFAAVRNRYWLLRLEKNDFRWNMIYVLSGELMTAPLISLKLQNEADYCLEIRFSEKA